LRENHGFIVIDHRFSINMQLNCPGEYDFFQITALVEIIFYAMCMGNPAYVLFNDRAGIKFLRHIMTGGPDNLYAPSERSMIGLGPRKRGQERMVDVYDLVGIPINYFGGDYLHVPGQDDKVYLVFLQ